MALKTDQEKCAHLLRRMGLGASESEIDFYLQGGGIEAATDKILNYEQFEAPEMDLTQLQNDRGIIPIPAIIVWWTMKILRTRRPLEEKLTLFWHDHFATSASKVKNPMLMWQQNRTLRANASGKFYDILTAVSKDPAMLQWLDNIENVKGHANENFAREIMELFTLGIGHYSEMDIQEAARAFTGWAFRRQRGFRQEGPGEVEFFFRPFYHDDGEKTIFGKTGYWNGDDVITMLCNDPQTSKYLTYKLWEWFVYPKPDDDTVEHFARIFRRSGLDVRGLLKEILHSPDFYSERAERAIYKNPVDFTFATVRQLGIGSVDVPQRGGLRNLGPGAALSQGTKGMGMSLMFPPDVAGWDWGTAWITTATMLERIGWAERLFGIATPARGRAVLQYSAFELFQSDPTPQGVAKTLVSIFDAPLPPEKVSILVQAAKEACGSGVNRQNANATAAAVSKLIFASPEFQMC